MTRSCSANLPARAACSTWRDVMDKRDGRAEDVCSPDVPGCRGRGLLPFPARQCTRPPDRFHLSSRGTAGTAQPAAFRPSCRVMKIRRAEGEQRATPSRSRTCHATTRSTSQVTEAMALIFGLRIRGAKPITRGVAIPVLPCDHRDQRHLELKRSPPGLVLPSRPFFPAHMKVGALPRRRMKPVIIVDDNARSRTPPAGEVPAFLTDIRRRLSATFRGRHQRAPPTMDDRERVAPKRIIIL